MVIKPPVVTGRFHNTSLFINRVFWKITNICVITSDVKLELLYPIKSYYTINGLCLFIPCVALTLTPPPPPPGSLQLVPVTRIDIKKIVTTGAVSTHDEQEMSQTLADHSEVVFDQPEESAGAMEPEGSLRNWHRKETWLEGTEPYRGARPRTMDFDRPVDRELGATSGEVGRKTNPL